MRHPIAILGAGPVGLAAAAHTVQRGLDFVLLEQGAIEAAMLQWGHVRLFSPWCYTVDAAARALLDAQGWQSPEDEALPTGAEIVRDYLTPLAKHPAIAPHMRTGTRVTAITRAGRSKLDSDGRNMAPFVIHWQDAAGQAGRTLARAVIDATSIWGAPNPYHLRHPGCEWRGARRRCRAAHTGDRCGSFGDQRGAGPDGAAITQTIDPHHLGHAARRYCTSGRRRVERSASRPGPIGTARHRGDCFGAADIALTLRSRADRPVGRKLDGRWAARLCKIGDNGGPDHCRHWLSP